MGLSNTVIDYFNFIGDLFHSLCNDLLVWRIVAIFASQPAKYNIHAWVVKIAKTSRCLISPIIKNSRHLIWTQTTIMYLYQGCIRHDERILYRPPV